MVRAALEKKKLWNAFLAATSCVDIDPKLIAYYSKGGQEVSALVGYFVSRVLRRAGAMASVDLQCYVGH